MDYVKQLDTILRVVGIRIRQGVKVSRKTGFGLNAATNSEETSATDSSSVSDISSPTCEENSSEPAAVAAELSTCEDSEEAVESDSKHDSQGAEKLADKPETQQEIDPLNPELQLGRYSEEKEAAGKALVSPTDPDQASPINRSSPGTNTGEDQCAGKGDREVEGRTERGKGEGGIGEVGPLLLEQVVLKDREKTNVSDNDSGEDSYTSSNPCSSTEEETTPSQNEV